MNKKVLVSVVIPTYKRCLLLERAIKSVLNQTYSNIEIIVVDDNEPNSKDRVETELIVRKYKRVRYIQQFQNLGANAARNTGIKHAKGDFIAFLDDDDEYLNTKIEKQVKVALEHQSTNGLMVFSSYNVIGNTSLQKSRWANKVKESIFTPSPKLIYSGNFIGSNSFVMVDAPSLKQINGFDENLKSSQDWDLYIRLANAGVRFIGINENLVNYYANNVGPRITTNSSARLSGYYMLYEKHKSHISKLDKDTRFNFYFYMYRRIISINFFSGVKWFPMLLRNNSSGLNYFNNIILAIGYPIVLFVKAILIKKI